MKTIYLIRHAKSDWKGEGVLDFERPLNNRGKNDTPLMGEKLNGLKYNPDMIYCSPAKRTVETVRLLGKTNLNHPYENILFDEALYHASIEDLKHLVCVTPSSIDNLAIIGHNPGLTLFSNYLTNDNIDNMTTCSIVKIELDIDNWNEIIEGIGTKKFYIYPKMYY